jgi:PAS domain S-box-containing protein
MTLETFAKLVENSNFSILITDTQVDWPGPRIVYANKTFEKITGYTKDEVLGKTPRILQGEKTDRNMLDRVRACLKEGRQFSGWTYNYRKDGSPFMMSWTVETIILEGEKHFLAVQTDVTNGVAKTLEEIKNLQLHALAQLT